MPSLYVEQERSIPPNYRGRTRKVGTVWANKNPDYKQLAEGLAWQETRGASYQDGDKRPITLSPNGGRSHSFDHQMCGPDE